MKGFSTFRMPKAVFYGNGALTNLGAQAALQGKKALIISDSIMEKLGNVDVCEKYLEEEGVSFVRYVEVNSEPTDVYVSEALAILKEQQCDLIVAVGGGSCLDVAKAVAVVATNGGYIGDYMGGKRK